MAAVASNEALRSHQNRNGAMGPDDLFLDAQLRALRHVAVFRALHGRLTAQPLRARTSLAVFFLRYCLCVTAYW